MEHIPLGSTHVCPLCSSASLVPTESTQPCAASPRFALPSPIAPRELIPGIDIDAGETAPTLARFLELECGRSPVSGLSASASETCESRERRRSVLLEDDCWFSDNVDATRGDFGLSGDASVPLGSRATTSSGRPSTAFAESVFTSATDDMDDSERRGLSVALGSEEVVVEETEFEAALRGSCFTKADDDGRARDMGWVRGGPVVTAASARTPPTTPLNTADPAGEEGVEVEGIGRPNSRRTIRSHLRLSSRRSDSCIAS